MDDVVEQIEGTIDYILQFRAEYSSFMSAYNQSNHVLKTVKIQKGIVDLTDSPPKDVGDGGAPRGVHGSGPGEVDNRIFDEQIPDKLGEQLALLDRQWRRVIHTVRDNDKSEFSPIDRRMTIAEKLQYSLVKTAIQQRTWKHASRHSWKRIRV